MPKAERIHKYLVVKGASSSRISAGIRKSLQSFTLQCCANLSSSSAPGFAFRIFGICSKERVIWEIRQGLVSGRHLFLILLCGNAGNIAESAFEGYSAEQAEKIVKVVQEVCLKIKAETVNAFRERCSGT